MEITFEKLEDASLNQQLVTAAVLRAVASAPKPFADVADLQLALGSTIDGVLAALAWIIEGSSQYPTAREKKRLANHCRDALVKFGHVAERDMAAGEDWEIGPLGQPN